MSNTTAHLQYKAPPDTEVQITRKARAHDVDERDVFAVRLRLDVAHGPARGALFLVLAQSGDQAWPAKGVPARCRNGLAKDLEADRAFDHLHRPRVRYWCTPLCSRKGVGVWCLSCITFPHVKIASVHPCVHQRVCDFARLRVCDCACAQTCRFWLCICRY